MATRLIPGARKRAITMLASLAAAPALATTYYVSPTGSDVNSGTNPNVPWGSVAKVDATTFQPGDQILFQYGSTWGASLDATSSGTTSAPIVYGSYGNPTLGNPTFMGSDPISSSAFTQLTGTTYQTTYAIPVNWVYDSHQFTHQAQDALTLAGSPNAHDPATDLSYVENNPNSFYYNAGNGRLYVNMGSTLAGQSLTLATREDAIYSNQKNNLIFQNLNTSETAVDIAGYGVRIENSTNVKLLNSTVSLSGKHAVGVVDTVGFAGTNLVASGTAPDLGYGGATAFAAYGDANAAVSTSTNNTSVWTNISYVNPNGAYPVFISHGNANGIANVTINNVVSLGGYGTGIDIYTTQPSETAIINGARLNGSETAVETNNSVINGVTLTGGFGQVADISVGGSHSVVQNTVVNGVQSNVSAGQEGAIIDNGANNTIRFNVAYEGYESPAIAVTNQNSSTNIYGNVFQVSSGVTPAITGGIGLYFNGAGTIKSNYNVYGPPSQFLVYPAFTNITAQQWQSMGYDANSLFATPIFNNAANGDFSLQSSSPGIGLYPSGLDPTLTLANAFLGSPQANGNYNAGLNPYVPVNLTTVSTGILMNNGYTATVTPIGNTLTVQAAGSMIVLNGSTLDMVGNVANAGTFVVVGGLIQTGNFNNSGTVVVGGSQLWSPGTTFTNVSGAATFQSDAGGLVAPAEYLAINASGGLITFTSTQHLTALTVGSGARVQVTTLGTTGRSLIFTPSLSVAGTLDLSGNDLIVEGGNVAAVTVLVKQGYNLSGGGFWNGNGITSSTAAGDTTHLTTLGVILNTADGINPLYGTGGALGLFDGASPGPADVLVRYTYYGDANLNGRIDGSDYARIDNGYLLHLTGWYNGDFNYDGVVNGSDYTLIDNAFNSQGPPMVASITAEIGATSVPEPSALAAIALAVPLLLRRRGSWVEIPSRT